jgi:hypothetical protein
VGVRSPQLPLAEAIQLIEVEINLEGWMFQYRLLEGYARADSLQRSQNRRRL